MFGSLLNISSQTYILLSIMQFSSNQIEFSSLGWNLEQHSSVCPSFSISNIISAIIIQASFAENQALTEAIFDWCAQQWNTVINRKKTGRSGISVFADHHALRDAMFISDRGTGAQQFRGLVMSEIHRPRRQRHSRPLLLIGGGLARETKRPSSLVPWLRRLIKRSEKGYEDENAPTTVQI